MSKVKRSIDTQANRTISGAVGMMTGSGMAGGTVLGGVEAATKKAGDIVKANVESADTTRSDVNALRYASLEQQAKEGQLNREVSLLLNRPTSAPRTPGLDVFGAPMAGSVQDIQLQQNQQVLNERRKMLAKPGDTSNYPNIGQNFPGLF